MAATTTEMGASSDPPALKMESPASSDFYGHGGGSATGGDFACSGFESPSDTVATNGDPYGAGQPSYVDALPPQASPYSLATSGGGGGGDVYPAASGHYPCPAGALDDRPPSLHRQDDPYSFVDDYGDHKSLSSAPAAAVQSQPARPPQQLPLPLLPFQFPKKRGRKPKKLLEAMAAAGMEVPKYKTPVRSTDPNKPRKKRDRFNGLSEEELIKLTLPDHLTHGMDIVFIGINPGLLSAFKGHHYAGPGDHFWKCIYLAGLIPEPLVAEDDYKLSDLKIGFTNVVSRTTKGSQELTRKELKEGGKLLLTKLQSFQPKVAVFNGKGIFEIFSGKKEFMFGKQPETIDGTLTHIWVMPSSSARCAQLPRALDKVPFFVALRKFRDHLNGHLPELDESEIVFQPPKRPPPVRREKDPTAAAAAGSAANGDLSGPPPLLDAEGQPLAAPVKKKRGRPRKIKLDENGVPLPVKPKPSRPRNVSSSASTVSADGCAGDLDGDGGAAARKKRGRPKKMAKTGDLMSGVGGLGGPLPPMSSLPPVGHLNGAGGALPSVYEISGVGPGVDEMTRLGMGGVGGYPTPGPGDYRHDSFSPPYGMSQQQPAAYHHPHLLHHHQQQQHHLQQQHMHPADLYGCGGYGAGPPSQLQHYGQSPGYSPAAGSSVYGQSPGVQQGGGGGPLCLTPPPTSPSLDQPDFEAPASMPSTSTDASRESSSGTAALLGQVKDDTMDGSATSGSGAGGAHGQQPAGSYSNPNTPSDPALTQYPSASGAPTPLSQSSPYQPGYNPNNGGVPAPLTQLSPYQPGGPQQQPQYPAVSQSSPFQPLVYATTSSGAPTPLSQSSPYTPGAQQALPIDFSQQQHPPGSVDNRSPSGGGYDESPPGGHHRVGLKSADIAAKSLSGLESLVDQIPSISHHQSVDSPAATAAALLGVHRTALPGATSISMPTAAPHIPGSSVGGHHGESPPTDGYSPQHQQQGYGYVGSPYCASSYSPPSATSLSAQQQQNGSASAGSGYSSSNFTAISLASSSVGSGGGLGGGSPGPSAVPPVAGPGGIFSSPAALSAGYGGMSMYHHPYGSYAAAAAAASAAPYSGFHVPSPRFPYPPTAYAAPSPYHPAHHHPSMHPHHPHQNYPPQPSVFERWKQDHMDMRFGGGF